MSVLREMRSRLEVVQASRVEPCLPTVAAEPPSGPGWIHEIKHDGFRMMLRRDVAGVRLIPRGGYNWVARYPLIGKAAESIKAKSFLIDGEAVACDETGLAEFQRLRRRADDRNVFLYERVHFLCIRELGRLPVVQVGKSVVWSHDACGPSRDLYF